MMIDANFPLYALLIANSVLLAAAVLTIVRFRRMFRESAKFWNSPNGAAIQMRCPTQQEQSKLIIHEIAVLQRSVAKLCERERTPVQPLPNKLPLRHAVRMARHGASIEDLTKGCGLNTGEARLMRKLHGGHAMPGVDTTVQ